MIYAKKSASFTCGSGSSSCPSSSSSSKTTDFNKSPSPLLVGTSAEIDATGSITNYHDVPPLRVNLNGVQSILNSRSGYNLGDIISQQFVTQPQPDTFPIDYSFASDNNEHLNRNPCTLPSASAATTVIVEPRDSSFPVGGRRIRYPRCAKCVNHGQWIPVKNHKRFCQWRDCHCERCRLTNFNKRIKAAQVQRHRLKKQNKELGLSVPQRSVPEASPLLALLLTLDLSHPLVPLSSSIGPQLGQSSLDGPFCSRNGRKQ